MVPEVYAVLKDRWEAAGRPEQGWVFPSDSAEGHLNKDTTKDQHEKALRDSGVTPFTVGQTFEHIFNMAGTCSCHCEVHGCSMSGTVMVM